MTSKGQVTLPKEVREQLHLGAGSKISFTVESPDRVVISPKHVRLSDLAGILGKPPRSLSLKEIDDVIARAAIERFRRST